MRSELTLPLSFPPNAASFALILPLIFDFECVSISFALMSPLIFASSIKSVREIKKQEVMKK